MNFFVVFMNFMTFFCCFYEFYEFFLLFYEFLLDIIPHIKTVARLTAIRAFIPYIGTEWVGECVFLIEFRAEFRETPNHSRLAFFWRKTRWR